MIHTARFATVKTTENGLGAIRGRIRLPVWIKNTGSLIFLF
jgi:hypothetical protein